MFAVGEHWLWGETARDKGRKRIHNSIVCAMIRKTKNCIKNVNTCNDPPNNTHQTNNKYHPTSHIKQCIIMASAMRKRIDTGWIANALYDARWCKICTPQIALNNQSNPINFSNGLNFGRNQKIQHTCAKHDALSNRIDSGGNRNRHPQSVAK